MKYSLFIMVVVMGFANSAYAEITTAKSNHYVLKQEATSNMPPEKLWARLIKPSTWWHPDHTYSGSSENLSLDLQAGGLWREDWEGGSVAHGTVLTVQKGNKLVLDAPFGPLQGMAVNVVWTITITPHEGGSKVVFGEIANGTDDSHLDKIAPAVDFVKTEAIKRLVDNQ